MIKFNLLNSIIGGQYRLVVMPEIPHYKRINKQNELYLQDPSAVYVSEILRRLKPPAHKTESY